MKGLTDVVEVLLCYIYIYIKGNIDSDQEKA